MKPEGEARAFGESPEDVNFRQTPWACARQRRGLDSETMACLRANLEESFERAETWRMLRRGLRQKGVDMLLRAGRLRLVDRYSGVEICTFRRLGHPRTELEARFGRSAKF